MIKLVASNPEEKRKILTSIVAFNNQQVNFTQTPLYKELNFVIKDANDQIIAGISSELYLWNICFIDVLWVEEDHRGNDYGTMLLAKVEDEAKKQGCPLVHVDTFDFQAKDFYIKQGYEIFGVLDDCPPGHQRFYLKKKL